MPVELPGVRSASTALPIIQREESVHDSKLNPTFDRGEARTLIAKPTSIRSSYFSESRFEDRLMDSFISINRDILDALGMPIGKMEKGLKRRIIFNKSFSFKFPYREEETDPWILADFIMLKGTKVDISVKSKISKGRETRRSIVELSGRSALNRGFWGPINGEFFDDEPFPGIRIDKLVVTEVFNAKTGKPINSFRVEDDRGRRRRIPYKVEIWLSMHDEEDGKNKGCSWLKSAIGNLFIDMKCAKLGRSGKRSSGVNVGDDPNVWETYKVNVSKQVYLIFKDIGLPAPTRKAPAGGLLSRAHSDYMEHGGQGSALQSRGVDFAVLMYHLWKTGLSNNNIDRDIEGRIKEMEKEI